LCSHPSEKTKCLFQTTGVSDLPTEIQKSAPLAAVLWWVKTTLPALLSLFFLIYGIETMLGAYSLKNPMEFMMYFFSASFMILVSSVGVVFAFFKIQGRIHASRTKNCTGGNTET
jgi:hypothetical protein